MRRAILLILGLCFLIVSISEVSAFWWKDKEAEEVDKAVGAGKTEPGKVTDEEARSLEEEARLRQRELKEARRGQLNNTEWNIELSLFGSKQKDNKDADIVTFADNKVVSAKLSKRKFAATNYTLTIQKDESLVWETMQTAPSGEVAFWRGEISSDMNKMRGILSHKINDKTSYDYYFWSTDKSMLPASGSE